ncbi:DUF2799 domain-containing protein [Endozoicomonas sp. Mp262]|uniref:DUF2799 domain-containing protein n=1 Tax=Endozoicomonas sp. Mp262 TaxID=2919499 RepID=UPI0021DF4C60
MIRFVGLIGVLLISGCSSLTVEQCTAINWQSVGYKDGANGVSPQPAKHGRGCSGYGVYPDYNRYEEGYRAGLSRYCTPGKGFTEGRAGHNYKSVCPASSEPAFLEQYQLGLSYNQQEKEQKRREEEHKLQQDKEQRRERDIKMQISSLKDKIFFNDMSLSFKRNRLNDLEPRLNDSHYDKYDLDIWRSEAAQLRREIHQLERQNEKARDHLNSAISY